MGGNGGEWGEMGGNGGKWGEMGGNGRIWGEMGGNGGKWGNLGVYGGNVGGYGGKWGEMGGNGACACACACVSPIADGGGLPAPPVSPLTLHTDLCTHALLVDLVLVHRLLLCCLFGPPSGLVSRPC